MKEKILGAIKGKINRRSWENWFSTFDVKEMTSEQVTFEVGNLFIKEWLEKKYGPTISKALKEVFEKDMPFSIVYSSATEASVKNVQANEPLVKKRPLIITPLNPGFSFENFVVGPSNMFAYSTSVEVAKNPGKFNPVFLCGGVGLGKTHLVQSIGHYTFRHHPDLRVVYLTSERFLNELVDSIKLGKGYEFREKYRTKVDVLLLDDVQFLIGKKGIQSELFHTFNELYNAGKQIVICSDRNPKDLEKFQDRLISRFQMGIVAEIGKPDREICKKIALKMIEREKASLDMEIVELIAEHFSDNIRRLRGAVVKLIAYQQMSGEKVTPSDAYHILGISSLPPKIGAKERIFLALSSIFGVSREEILSNARRREVVSARHIGIYVAKTYLGMSLRAVAELFGRSHPTVSHTVRKIDELIASGNMMVRSQIEKVVDQLRAEALGQNS